MTRSISLSKTLIASSFLTRLPWTSAFYTQFTEEKYVYQYLDVSFALVLRDFPFIEHYFFDKIANSNIAEL